MIVSFRGQMKWRSAAAVEAKGSKAQGRKGGESMWNMPACLWCGDRSAATAAWCCVVCGEPSYSPSCYGRADGRTDRRRVAAMDGDGQIYLSNRCRSKQPFASLTCCCRRLGRLAVVFGMAPLALHLFLSLCVFGHWCGDGVATMRVLWKKLWRKITGGIDRDRPDHLMDHASPC